jgi:hypothetical protein
MTLPYENATSGAAAMEETQRILRGFGVKKIGVMEDDEKAELVLQFELRGRLVQVAASAKGYAAAWLRHNPWTSRKQCSQQQWEAKALQQARISVYSILRDWIKGQVTAVEVGMLSFEGAFLGQILLGNGQTVLETVTSQQLLPAPEPI